MELTWNQILSGPNSAWINTFNLFWTTNKPQLYPIHCYSALNLLGKKKRLLAVRRHCKYVTAGIMKGRPNSSELGIRLAGG